MDEKKKLTRGELIAYIIAGLFAIWGIVFFIIGVIGDHYPGLYSDNWVALSENSWLTNWSHMGYRNWGLIIFMVGVLITVITLNVVARTSSKDDERANRRKQRQLLNQPIEAKVEEAPVPQAENNETKEEKAE